MRYKKKLKYIKVINRFLIFPKEINGEVRWLEAVSYLKKYRQHRDGGYWETVRWVDSPRDIY